MAARHYSLKKSAEAALASLLTGPGTSRAAHSKSETPALGRGFIELGSGGGILRL